MSWTPLISCKIFVPRVKAISDVKPRSLIDSADSADSADCTEDDEEAEFPDVDPSVVEVHKKTGVQSAQSVPTSHVDDVDPSPPSSQTPLFADPHESEQV